MRRTHPHLPPAGMESPAAAPLRVQEGSRRLCHALFSGLRFLPRLGSVLLFLQPHLSWVFIFLLFPAVSPLLTPRAGSAGASRRVSKQPALAVTQSLNAAVGTLFRAPRGGVRWCFLGAP